MKKMSNKEKEKIILAFKKERNDVENVKIIELEDDSFIISYTLKEKGYYYCPICKERVETILCTDDKQLLCSKCNNKIIWKENV